MPTTPSALPKLDRDSLLSRTFTALKWILALMVVTSHFVKYWFMPDAIEKTAPWSGRISNLVYAFITNCEVPLFFIMSGFFFCTTAGYVAGEHSRKIKQRLFSLGVPYVTFIIYGLAVTWIFCWATGDFSVWNDYSTVDKLTGYRNIFPVNTPLWYMRDLMLLCLLAPVFAWLINITRGWIIALLTVLFIACFQPYTIAHYLMGLLFFPAGYMIRLRGADLLRLSRQTLPYLLPAYIAIGLLIACNYVDSHFWLKNIEICLSVPVIFAVVSYLVEWGRVKPGEYLGSVTFFIFLTHHPLRQVAVYIYARFWPTMGDGGYLLALGLTILSVVVGLGGIFCILDRFCPRVAALITGRRTVAPKTHRKAE